MKLKNLSIFLIFPFLFSQDGEALEFYLKGEYAKLINNYDDAIINFQKASLLDSNSAIIFNQLAKCYIEKKDTIQAKIYFNKVLKKSNYSIEFSEDVLNFYENTSEENRSRVILDSLISYNPSNIDLRFKKIKYDYFDKNYEDLLYGYKEIIYLNPDDTEIIPKMVDIGLTLGMDQYLEILIIEIIRDFPKLTQPHVALAGVKFGNENNIDGILAIEKAYNISKDENLIINLVNLSKNISYEKLYQKYLNIYEQNHSNSIQLKYLKMELAIEEMQYYYAQKLIIELLEIGDSNLILYENLIFICKKLNELDIAYKKINLQYEFDSNNIIYPLLLGDIKYYQRLDNEALNWYKIALKLDKNNSNLRHRVANLSESLFKYELSDSIFTKIIEYDSTDASGFNNYAYSLCERPNPNLEFALELSQKAIKLEPENAAFLDTIGWIYYRLGNYDLALNYIFKSAKLDQKSEIILNHLAEVYLKLNNINEALNIYLEILDLNPKNQIALEKLKELSHE